MIRSLPPRLLVDEADGSLRAALLAARQQSPTRDELDALLSGIVGKLAIEHSRRLDAQPETKSRPKARASATSRLARLIRGLAKTTATASIALLAAWGGVSAWLWVTNRVTDRVTDRVTNRVTDHDTRVETSSAALTESPAHQRLGRSREARRQLRALRQAAQAAAAVATTATITVPLVEREPPSPAPELKRPQRTQRAPPWPDDSTSENNLLEPATRALHAGEFAAALTGAEQHLAAFPHGALAQTRELVAIEALLALGDDRKALERARAFRRRFPASLYMTKLNRLVPLTSEARGTPPTE